MHISVSGSRWLNNISVLQMFDDIRLGSILEPTFKRRAAWPTGIEHVIDNLYTAVHLHHTHANVGVHFSGMVCSPPGGQSLSALDVDVSRSVKYANLRSSIKENVIHGVHRAYFSVPWRVVRNVSGYPGLSVTLQDYLPQNGIRHPPYLHMSLSKGSIPACLGLHRNITGTSRAHLERISGVRAFQTV